MLKLLLLAAILATVSANVLEKYVGEVIPVMMYPKDGNVEFCFYIDVSLPNITCKCDGATLPALKTIFIEDEATHPIKVVDNEKDALDALKKECTCDDKPIFPAAIVPYNDNYFIYYVKESETEFSTILFAKTKPTPKELNDFIKSKDDLKDKSGDLICTTESVDLKNVEAEESKRILEDIKKEFINN